MTSRSIARGSEYEADLTSRVDAAATVLPALRRQGGGMAMGAFDGDDQPIEDCLLFRTYGGVERQIGFPGELPPPRRRERQRGSAIYMGTQFRHFGHFLLEGLSRVWFAKSRPDLPIVWSVQDPVRARARHTYKQWQADLLALIGVHNRPIFVSHATRFGELIVPEPGYQIQDYFHPVHRDQLAVVDHAPQPGRYTWLSRARLDRDKGSNRSADLLERRLADAGWQIVYPEELSIVEQVSILAASERVAGEEGSAFHLLLFLRDTAGLKVDIIARSPDLRLREQNQNYETIASSKGLDQTIHRLDFERIIDRRFSVVHKIAQNSFKYLEALSVQPGDPADDGQLRTLDDRPEQSRTARLLKQIGPLRGTRSYLEVGVADGGTILNVDFEVMHGVDPELRFDPRPFETGETTFFEMTSDDFFVNFADAKMKYDLIVIDGRTFEQTFRDLCASMSHQHETSIWIINHVLGDDDGEGGTQGGAFGVVCAIHDLFPNLSYRTIVSGWDAQSVVVHRPRRDFAPVFAGLEAISRLSRVEFRQNQALLNTTSEEDALTWLAD